MRNISRRDLLGCLDHLRQDPPYDLGQLEADIFGLFDDREVRMQRSTTERFIRDEAAPDPSGLYNALDAMESRVHWRRAIVDPYVYVDNDYRDEAPPEDFLCPQGYFDTQGVFVPVPTFSPLPRYCQSTDDAMRLMRMVFNRFLLLKLEEGETSEYEFKATLCTEAGETVSSYSADGAPSAIVGATLSALATGWIHPLMAYRLAG